MIFAPRMDIYRKARIAPAFVMFMSHLQQETDLVALWRRRLNAGELAFDPAQENALKAMQGFLDRVTSRHAPQNFLSRFAGMPRPEAPDGFYLYGDVGRGKTMLMDMFYDALPALGKRRVHFHSFMLEIHQRLYELQQRHVDEVLPGLAREMAQEIHFLCFDEFHVGNIADAMILGRLFSALFEAGVTIMATSNWAPDELYKNGLQRERFLPFIELIKKHMTIYRLEGRIDYRYQQVQGLPICFYPLSEDTTRKLQGIFLQLTGEAPPEPIDLPLQGRVLRIVHAAKGVGFFNFDELCGQPLGSADFLAIAHSLHTVLIDGVPVMQADRRDETMRFMTLIDALYEAKTKLFMAAARPPEKLAPQGEHAFAFTRTISRLAEMGSEEYRQKPHMA